MSKDTWELGKWWVVCDRCGLDRTNDNVRKEWTGLIVCSDTCWETRHPQEFVRVKPDKQAVPFTRPPSTDRFVEVTYADTGADDIPAGTFNNGL